MALYNPANSPEQNLEVLASNPYPGRLIVVGAMGELTIQAYAIMGRSEGSRNRVLSLQDNVVSTEVFNPSLPVGDPSLTIYDAMRQIGDVHVVSNGNQTNTIAQYLRSGNTIQEALDVTGHEPDAPNFTPRITGFYNFDADDGAPQFGLSVISKGADGGSVRKLYTDQEDLFGETYDDYNISYGVHTYNGDGNPLPSFDQVPFTLPVHESAHDMAGMIWENLNPDNRVAVAAKVIQLSGGVEFALINRHDPGGL
ncbi:MAG: IMP cyclohydrolase [Candidatus Saccharimonadales bacterium]